MFGDWWQTMLCEVTHDARVKWISQIKWGRQTSHRLPELSGDAGVGCGLVPMRSWVKGDPNERFTVGDVGAAFTQSIEERSTEISCSCAGHKFSGMMCRKTLVRVTIWVLVPIHLKTLHVIHGDSLDVRYSVEIGPDRSRQQVLVRSPQQRFLSRGHQAFRSQAQSRPLKCPLRVVSVQKPLMQVHARQGHDSPETGVDGLRDFGRPCPYSFRDSAG